MKIYEARCSRCCAKIVQTGRGRRATMCAECRKRRQDEWRQGKQKAAKKAR